MFKRVQGVCRMSLIKSLRHPRTVLLLILLFIFMDYTLGGIRDFCRAFDVRVSLFEMLAQMFSNAKVQGGLILFFAFLITDLPGTDLNEQYILVRSGKLAWMAGKLGAVLILSLIWLLVIVVYLVVIVWRLDLSTEWSRAMFTLAQTDVADSYSVRMIFENKVIINYSLSQAIVLSIGLNWALTVVGGIWALLLNFISRRPVGSFVLAVAAFISMSVGGILTSGAIYRISPVSLALLSVVNGGIEEAYPSLEYSLAFYGIAMLVGLGAVFLSVNLRKDYSRFQV